MKFRVTAAVAICTIGASMISLGGVANAAPTSAIENRYNSDSALRTTLGAPTDSEYSVAQGREQDFKWGSLYWSNSTGVHEVHGAIWWRYKALGGPKGFLGFPTTDEQQIVSNITGEFIHQGADNRFSGGELAWDLNRNITTWMDANIAKQWNLVVQPWPYYGMPQADERPTPHNGHSVSFFDSSIYTSPQTGTHSVIGGDAVLGRTIWNEYNLTNGAAGPLGLPVAEAVGVPTTDHPSGSEQVFQGGAIFQPEVFAPSHEVHGAIYWTYSHNNNLEKLGYPTTDEQAASGGRISHFDHGTIYWNSLTNKTTITLTP